MGGTDLEDVTEEDDIFHRRNLQDQHISRTSEQKRNLAALRDRQLQSVGVKTILAVRVVAADASYSDDEEALRDHFLGTNGDTSTSEVSTLHAHMMH